MATTPVRVRNGRAHWRYQSVFDENDGERWYSVCEVYLDAAGNLEGWTEHSSIAAGGNTLDELEGDLEQMITDVRRWEPVAFDSLYVGMTFKSADEGIR